MKVSKETRKSHLLRPPPPSPSHCPSLSLSSLQYYLLDADQIHLCSSQLQPPVQPATFPCSFLAFGSCRWAAPSSTLPKADPSALLPRGLASCRSSGSTPQCGSHVPRQKHGTHCDAPGSVLNISPITNLYYFPYD